MAAPCFIAWNSLTGSASTTTHAPAWPVAQPVGVTAATWRTMLQIKPGTPKVRVVEWGYSFDAVPTALVRVGLVTTGTGFATMTTALGAGDVMPYNDSTGPASGVVTGSTTASGFSTAATTEVSISANTTNYLAVNNEFGQSFKQQFPLGREPEVNGGTSLRVLAYSSSAVNMSCYIIWEE